MLGRVVHHANLSLLRRQKQSCLLQHLSLLSPEEYRQLIVSVIHRVVLGN